jgi:transcriptional regulator GlxA family with amidase domain
MTATATRDGTPTSGQGQPVHRVAVLALDDLVPFGAAVPLEAFLRARQLGLPYEVQLCGAGAVRAGRFGTWQPSRDLQWARDADTVIVPGRYEEAAPADDKVLALLRDLYADGRRLASVCAGAFVLAQAGLLDGRPATTHWFHSDLLGDLHPRVRVDPRPLYVDDGQVLTSAGLAAGLDLCVHLVRSDHGAAAAARLARALVVAPHREGGQAQYLDLPAPRADGTTAALRAWLLEHLDVPVTLAGLAVRAHTSERTLLRRFQSETGQTPMQWITAQRLAAARVLLEAGDDTMDDVAHRTGLGSAANLRQHFRRHLGVTPAHYRSMHRHPPSRLAAMAVNR